MLQNVAQKFRLWVLYYALNHTMENMFTVYFFKLSGDYSGCHCPASMKFQMRSFLDGAYLMHTGSSIIPFQFLVCYTVSMTVDSMFFQFSLIRDFFAYSDCFLLCLPCLCFDWVPCFQSDFQGRYSAGLGPSSQSQIHCHSGCQRTYFCSF